jgi:hypothetical protein
MNDPIAFSGFIAFMALVVLGAYQLGFAHGHLRGFKGGQASAKDFARLKRLEEIGRNGTHLD